MNESFGRHTQKEVLFFRYRKNYEQYFNKTETQVYFSFASKSILPLLDRKKLKAWFVENIELEEMPRSFLYFVPTYNLLTWSKMLSD